MDTRKKALLWILAVVLVLAAGGLFYYQNKLKSSADSFSGSRFNAFSHHIADVALPGQSTKPFDSSHHEPSTPPAAFKKNLTGTVYDAVNKNAISGIKIEIKYNNRPDLNTSTVTDKDGKYAIVFNVLSFKIVATDSTGNYVQATQLDEQNLSTDSIRNITMNPTKTSISGKVTDVNNKPLSRISVFVGPVVPDSKKTQGVVTDAAGNYKLTVSSASSYNILAKDSAKKYFELKSVNNYVGYTPFVKNIQLILATQAIASGSVFRDGQPATNAVVTIGQTVSSPNLRVVPANAQGKFEVKDLEAGNYVARVNERSCTRYLWFNICKTRSASQPFTLINGKSIVIPSLYIK